jgi:dTDP-4-amino-4,6-dideoxygalactose transaminase
MYNSAFKNCSWAELPIFETISKKSSYHVYPLRIKNVAEEIRDKIIQSIFEKQVSVNVHFQPLPLFTAYKKLGFSIENYPVAFNNYSREISLPVYFDLTDEMVHTVINAVSESVSSLI